MAAFPFGRNEEKTKPKTSLTYLHPYIHIDVCICVHTKHMYVCIDVQENTKENTQTFITLLRTFPV